MFVVATHETSFTVRGATGVILQSHQIPCLPRQLTLMIDPPHIRNVVYNARSNRTHPPNHEKLTLMIDPRHIIKRHLQPSPDTAPATKNDSDDRSSSYMQRHLQCAKEQNSPSNVTKYFACHEKWLSCNVIYNAQGNRTHLPKSPNSVPRELHEIVHLPRKVAVEPHQIVHLPRSDTRTSPNCAPATKSDAWTSRNSHLPRKVTLQLHQIMHLPDTWTIAWLSYCLILLLLDSTITWLYFYLTLLWLDPTMTWLYYCLALLLLDSTIT